MDRAKEVQDRVQMNYARGMALNTAAVGGSYVDNSTNHYIEWNSGYPGVMIAFQGPLLTTLGGGTKQIVMRPVVSSDQKTIRWTCETQFNYPLRCAYLPSNCQANCN